MEIHQIVDIVMNKVPTDSSGKWVSVEELREVLTEVLDSDWDYYSDLPSPSAYQGVK
jgi:hypothetical protein